MRHQYHFLKSIQILKNFRMNIVFSKIYINLDDSLLSYMQT